MLTRPTDDIELEDINREDDAIRDAQQGEEGETSFTDDRPDDDSILTPTFNFNPRLIGRMRRNDTQEKKNFLKKYLEVKVNKKDAPELFNNLTLTEGGVKYKGVDVLVTRDGVVGYNPDLSAQSVVNEFKGLIEKAKERYSKSLEGNIDKQAAENIGVEPSEVDTETAEEVIDRVYDRVQYLRYQREQGIVVDLETNEFREFRGILNIDKQNISEDDILKFLDETELKHWRDLSEQENNPQKKELYETIAKVVELKADEIRLRNNQVPKYQEVKEILKEEIVNSDMTRFQRFKKWARENLAGISAVTISIAGIVTTIVMAGRKAIRLGAKGVSSLARSVVALGKKLGPVVGAVLNLAGNILSLGAKGISFLANNLWLLAVLIVSYILYNKQWQPRRI